LRLRKFVEIRVQSVDRAVEVLRSAELARARQELRELPSVLGGGRIFAACSEGAAKDGDEDRGQDRREKRRADQHDDDAAHGNSLSWVGSAAAEERPRPRAHLYRRAPVEGTPREGSRAAGARERIRAPLERPARAAGDRSAYPAQRPV